jgi:hypothetical protein
MRSIARLFVLAALALVFFPATSSAQLSPGWFGTWHLDIARSTFAPGSSPYVRGTWKVSRLDDDRIVMVYDQIGVRGGVTHMEWKGHFDGNDYRLHGPDALVTYAYSIVDERNLLLVVKVDGRRAATSRVELAADGTVSATTDTTTARGPLTTVTVYAKR